MALFGSLMNWLRLNKAKGRTFGNVGELREVVMAALRARPDVDSVVPDADDSATFTVTMDNWTGTTDVRNLFGYISDYPEEVEEAITRFVNSHADIGERTIEDSDIVAVIRTGDYVEEVMRSEVEVLHEPVGADLFVVYMADRPDAMSLIRTTDLPDKALADVREIAFSNVRKWLPKVVADDIRGKAILYYVEGNTMLSTTLVLLEEFWSSVAARFPGDVLFAIPRKDQLFVFDDDGDEETMNLAHRLIDATFEGKFIPLSPLVYARRNGQIVVVSD